MQLASRFGYANQIRRDIICSTSVSHILAVQKSTQLQIDTLIRHQVSDIS
ncbi:TPA: hypothetical protein RI346_000643 [Escherichia coli]|nr:hypothetical protein [Escherichia coli]